MCYGMGCPHEHPYTGECQYRGRGPRPCPDREEPERECSCDCGWSGVPEGGDTKTCPCCGEEVYCDD